MTVAEAYDILYCCAVLFLSAALLSVIVRSVIGPTTADRVVSVNMAGSVTVMILAILSVYLGESFIGDVCLIYVLISFVSVVVLCKVFTRRRDGKEE